MTATGLARCGCARGRELAARERKRKHIPAPLATGVPQMGMEF